MVPISHTLVGLSLPDHVGLSNFIQQNFAQRIYDEFHGIGVWADMTDLKECDPDEALSVEEVL